MCKLQTPNLRNPILKPSSERLDMDREQYDMLLAIAKSYLDTSQDVGIAELAESLTDVFGAKYLDLPEAAAFNAYFTEVQNYWQLKKEPDLSKPEPVLLTPPPFDGDTSMDVDPASTKLSNSALQAATLSVEAERTQRLIHNVSPRTNMKGGRTLNELTASLLIERKQNGKPVFRCIGCLVSSANKTTDRVHKHAINCEKLARDFPNEVKLVRAELEKKSTPAILENGGKGAPRIRTQGARHASDPYHKRTPVPGISPLASQSTTPSSTPAPSTSTITPTPPVQTTLEDNWGAGKITAPRQATIDYFLLRMIICCALAFSLLDNGFFLDFCLAMCPTYAVPDRSSFFVKHIAAEAAYVLTAACGT
ncbi:hypothetical protein GGX14DRAFT_393616 [Mycena pura]|uniref:Uncharacterized protein n=1 Tax=Mycena pura TaxID=153505 RepID=A0AAD6VIV1_9AGAR|nr:hypothetical protein GGX14DRAFT_393616 [Mycena pura]